MGIKARHHATLEAATTDSRVLGALLVTFGGGWLLYEAGVLAVGWDTLVAALLTSLGVGMIATPKAGNGLRLTMVGVLLTLVLASMSSINVQLSGGVGERVHAPASLVEVEERYELLGGELVVDLREVDFPRGRTTRISAQVGGGRLAVVLPPDVEVVVRAEVVMGEARAFGRVLGEGISVRESATLEPEGSGGDAPTVELDLSVFAGEIEVSSAAPGVRLLGGAPALGSGRRA